jgi:hypothetical protein
MARLITEVVPMPARPFTSRAFNGLRKQLSPMRLQRHSKRICRPAS